MGFGNRIKRAGKKGDLHLADVFVVMLHTNL
jgi:hypothetical protein